MGEKKTEEVKSKAELRAERRAKQEAQRAAKAAATNQKPAAKPKLEAAMVKTDKPVGDDVIKVSVIKISNKFLCSGRHLANMIITYPQTRKFPLLYVPDEQNTSRNT